VADPAVKDPWGLSRFHKKGRNMSVHAVRCRETGAPIGMKMDGGWCVCTGPCLVPTEPQERVTDLGCCHDAGDCAEPLCGRARPAGRVRALPAEPINDSRNQDWD
jgi:hypothetical protein